MEYNQSKTGAPPGTLVYRGKETAEKVKITLVEYNEGTYSEKDFYDFEECKKAMTPDRIKWINVNGIHKVELIETIGKHFNIHSLTLEDIVNTNQRPKSEDYDTYLVAIMKMIYYDNGIHSEQLSVILMDGMVISFQEIYGGDAFDMIRNRLRLGKGRVRRMGADYLAYALLDAVVDFYFNVLEKIGDKIELMEDEVVAAPSKKTLTQIHRLKREMIFLRKAVWPMRELISNLERSETELIKPSTDIYLRDLHDHAVRVIDTVETFRDLLSGMMDIYLSSVSNRMNETMKVLTIITTLFVPVTFIVGVYGMNFDFMPEIHSTWGYPITWAVIIATMASLLLYFRKKRWI